MFSIFQATFDNLESSTSLTTKPNQKRWHKALATIYCSRALSSLSSPLLKSKSTTNQKRWHKAFSTIYCSRALSSPMLKPKHEKVVIIDIFEPHPCFPKIDQSSLTQLVKQKDLNQLHKFGGVEGLASVLKTNLDDGIPGDDEDISRRNEAFGSNTYRMPQAKNLFFFVWVALKNPFVLMLLVLAALSLGFGIKENGLKEGWFNGGSMLVAVLLRIAISAICNFRKNRQLAKLSKAVSKIQVNVVRSRRQQQVSIFKIVVGDVVCLKMGDQVPADGLFIDGHSLVVEESSMTGESDHVDVDLSQNPSLSSVTIGDEVPADGLLISGHSSLVVESSITGESDHAEVDFTQNPFLYSGTKVADGFGRMLVTSVGMNTTWGEMISTIDNDSNGQTPLQSGLNKLTSSMRKLGIFVAFLVFLVLLIRYFAGNIKDENGNTEYNGSKTKPGDIINSVIGIIAAAVNIVDVGIPERLPLAVTLTLAYSKKCMMSDHGMVLNLSALETMGSVTTICTDKSGMLTLNEMKVKKFWLGQDFVNGNSSSLIAPSVVELLRQGVGLNTTSLVYKNIPVSPTEKAIHSWAVLELNLDKERLMQSYEILHVEGFNSKKKRSGVLMRKRGENTMNVHWKGAAEIVLAMCSNYCDVSGNVKVLDDFERKNFDGVIQGMAASSLQCIAFAHKQVPEPKNEEGNTKVDENCLTLLGLVGLKDTCQPDVKKAVEQCQYAGVSVKMITGDNIFTARAVATECGILKPNQDMESGAVVEGVEFRNFTPEERMNKVDKILVMARSSPFDKLLMVHCLKQKGHVVAVAGDGTNDVPTLKEANIGLSKGIQGSEVAKESSDVVILDDSFRSVASLLRWGRCVYTNIQKLIQFQLTMNVAALVINFVAAVSDRGVPLSAIQLAWVNLIMDTLGALALATGKPTKELMEKPPLGRTEPLVTNVMWRNELTQACYQIAVMLTLQFHGEWIFKVSLEVNDTMMFTVFVLFQVFNEFNARELEKKNVFKGMHKNKLFLLIAGLTIVLQGVMVEFLNKFVDTERLNWWQWGVCVGFASVSLPIGWVAKCIPVPEKPFFSFLKLKWGNPKAD